MHIRAYRIILTGTSLWCALIVLPTMLSSCSQPLAAACYKFFTPVCHQNPERSFFIMGKQCAVCIRCTSIYVGFFLSLLVYPHRTRMIRVSPRLWWLWAVLPMLLDVFLDTTGLHLSTDVTRLLTGGIAGTVAAQVLVPHMIEAVSQLLFHSTEYRISHEP